MKLKLDEIEDLEQRAVDAYYRNAKRHGLVPMQPSQIEYREDFSFLRCPINRIPGLVGRVVLENINGLLAEYFVYLPESWHKSQKAKLRPAVVENVPAI